MKKYSDCFPVTKSESTIIDAYLRKFQDRSMSCLYLMRQATASKERAVAWGQVERVPLLIALFEFIGSLLTGFGFAGIHLIDKPTVILGGQGLIQ